MLICMCAFVLVSGPSSWIELRLGHHLSRRREVGGELRRGEGWDPNYHFLCNPVWVCGWGRQLCWRVAVAVSQYVSGSDTCLLLPTPSSLQLLLSLCINLSFPSIIVAFLLRLLLFSQQRGEENHHSRPESSK